MCRSPVSGLKTGRVIPLPTTSPAACAAVSVADPQDLYGFRPTSERSDRATFRLWRRTIPGLGPPASAAQARKCSLCPGGIRSQFEIPSRILVSLQIEIYANQGRFPEEFHQALWLPRSHNQLIELFHGHHYDGVLTLPGDELRPLGPGQPEYLAKASLGRLYLPRTFSGSETRSRFDCFWHKSD